MKVLILANSDIGLYKFRRELIEELLKNNEVLICLPDGDFVEGLVELGCRFIQCEFDRHGKNPLDELRLIGFYKKIISENRPDIVLTYTIKPNIYGGIVCAGMRIPYVANITGLGTAVENNGFMQKVTLTLYKLGLRKAQKVFFQNTENRDFMVKRHILSGEYDLLPGSGVNLEQYSALEYPEGDTIDFVFAARVMKEKGIDQYLEAAEYIHKEYPQTRFHVCGFCEQDYEDKLRSLHDAGVIIYHGQVKNMVEIHEISKCTIHPTYYPEGLSNVLLESAACARPIITTNRAGCREVIDDGINGFAVEQKDSRDLIEKIEQFIALPRETKKQMGIEGRKKVEQEFDRRIVVEKYMQELLKIQKNQ